MDPPSTNKQRTPSRCREWERQRRLKFNDAISKLGEIVKSINKANSEEADNVQYPKIEIVQKAIICLNNCLQEKTQLKAEILALEVKIEAIEKQKSDKKDVSLQVTLGTNKKNPNSKYVKLVMLNKSKHKSSKEKEKIITAKPKTETTKIILDKTPPKLPKLLPLTNMKKENTIVMLPATPYIFPQRPVLFPQPPTIVLVDTNLQPISKSAAIPIINRNTNDITKTTMVNVLPISAYSHPLSAKSKKNNAKPRNTLPKKNSKKVKANEKTDITSDPIIDSVKEPEKSTDVAKTSNIVITESSAEKTAKSSSDTTNVVHETLEINKETSDTTMTHNDATGTNAGSDIPKVSIKNQKIIDQPKSPEPSKTESINEKPNAIQNESVTIKKSENNEPQVTKCSKMPPDKIVESDFKGKEDKIHPILDSTICENVDVGNARLELAEEFLAASPTAAFLMSFPLVSGNRADSPAEDAQNTTNSKENNHRSETLPHQIPYFEKPNAPENKSKTTTKAQNTPVTNTINKAVNQQKFDNIIKSTDVKTSTIVSNLVTNENPFLSLPLPSVVPSSCALTDSTFGIDFDISVNKTVTTQSTTVLNSTTNNIFYKGDPFNTVKSTIYSTSSISSGHEFNSLGLYPCAMENYANKNKSEFTNVEDNLMKIGTSRLTYDIDLGWSHKSFDFVNCTTNANNFHKDNILTNTTVPFSTTYNPFNPDFHHVPFVPNSTKKNSMGKAGTFPEQITSFYSQGPNLWSEDVSSIYTTSNVSKNFISKQQNYFPAEHLQTNMNSKTSSIPKQFDTKHIPESASETKSSSISGQHMTDKYTKKSPNKAHINWMTSETRPMQNNCNQNQTELKDAIKAPYSHNDQVSKKQTLGEGNYFPINMHNFPSQPNHEDHNVWPPPRPAGTTEISMEPPPINLPTLVGDLALGPHDKKKAELINRNLSHGELPNCSNFLSVTQLMNRSTEHMPVRSNGIITETQKPLSTKQNISHTADVSRKTRLENQSQVCYGFNDSKATHAAYEGINSFPQTKTKSNKDKTSKTQKNSYSAEALIRGGNNYSQNSGAKFMVPQKYNDFNITQESGVAQVSHFPPIIDYADNSYTGQQFSGTTLYNSTTNTISNSFYSNFMPSSSNLMAGNYAGSFPSDYVDYNQTSECNNYTNHKYSEFKMRNNITTFPQEKEQSNYKSSRRESATKHKLECSKKESSKKYQSKRPKLSNNEIEEWNDPSHLLWQNKNQNKKHQNIMSDDIPFPNYMGNQVPAQYQPDFFNSHIMQTNMQNVGPNADRSLSSFPVASRANFNLSALFPEITMKVQ